MFCLYLPTWVKSGSSRFTCVLYAGLAKGGFNSKSGCVLYADATYTRLYTVGISEGGEFWVNGRYICKYMYLSEGWDLTKQLGYVIIMLGLVGLFN